MGVWLAGMVDHLRMIIDLNETRTRTIEQVRAIVEGTETLELGPAKDAHARCAWIASVLGRRGTPSVRRPCQGIPPMQNRLSGRQTATIEQSGTRLA